MRELREEQVSVNYTQEYILHTWHLVKQYKGSGSQPATRVCSLFPGSRKYYAAIFPAG